MSAEAVGHVYRFCPYGGAVFQVLHAIADSANDQHHYEVWMLATTIAAKARVNERTARAAIDRLVADGWLEVVTPSDRGKAGRYRFLFDDTRAVVFETRKARRPSAGGSYERTKKHTGSQTRSGTDGARRAHRVTDPDSYGQNGSQTRSERVTDPDIEPKVNPSKVEPNTSRAAAPRDGDDGDQLALVPEPAPKEEYPGTFEETWAAYPRKLAKKAAFAAWNARRKAGVPTTEMHQAVLNYADECLAMAREPAHILHGATFFGPKERWRDYVAGPELRPGATRRNGHQQRPGLMDQRAATAAALGLTDATGDTFLTSGTKTAIEEAR